MGTRAIYIFRNKTTDWSEEYSVYGHWDGYPSYAALRFAKALDKGWKLPRYEADEFAAAFVAANKDAAGDIRLATRWSDYGDIEYVYVLSQANNGQLIMQAYKEFDQDTDDLGETFFYGRLKDFIGAHGNDDAKAKWNSHDKNTLHPLVIESKAVQDAVKRTTVKRKVKKVLKDK